MSRQILLLTILALAAIAHAVTATSGLSTAIRHASDTHTPKEPATPEEPATVPPPPPAKRVVRRKCLTLRCRKCVAKCTVKSGVRAAIPHAVRAGTHSSDDDAADAEKRAKDARRDDREAARRRSGVPVGKDKTDGGRDHRLALERRKKGGHSGTPVKPVRPRRGLKDLLEALRRRGLVCKGLPCKTCKKACVRSFGTNKIVYKA